MAKGSLNGVRRGKQGNTVFFKIANSNNKEVQGSREYVASIRNPKTTGQLAQRVKLAPAVNFYKAFEAEILNHSWQGVQYGARSHSEFMKRALSMTAGFPFVPKDTTRLVPGAYQISRGSVPGIQVDYIDGASIATNCDFQTTSDLSYESNVNSILAANPKLKQGDQITLVAVLVVGSVFVPRVARIVLDASKYPANATAEEVFGQCGIFLSDEYVNFCDVEGNPDLTTIKAAAAVIVSRPVVSKTSGAVTWQRSNARMVLNENVMAPYFTDDAYNAAVDSYRNSSASVSSTWYLNGGTTSQATEDAETPIEVGTTYNVQMVESDVITGATSAQKDVALYRDEFGDKCIISQPTQTSLNVYKLNADTGNVAVSFSKSSGASLSDVKLNYILLDDYLRITGKFIEG